MKPSPQFIELPAAAADRLRALADELDRLAKEHCELLDFEGHTTDLTKHAAGLKTIVRLLTHRHVGTVLAEIAEEAEQHIAFVRDYVDAPEKGDAS